MIIFKKADDIHRYLLNKKNENQSIGFVPTMGALHEGHISLITQCKQDNQLTVCSIFVNPTQFNNKQDLEKYPITIEEDIKMLEAAQCDVLFLPDTAEIYPTDFIKIHYELGPLENILEGKYRPGHFQGVCMVVDRLLSIVTCQTLYLGQKDYQQCMVLEKMITLRKIDTVIKIMPTVRETDGLAMSSRNRRLNDTDRKKSTVIFSALNHIKSNLNYHNPEQLIEEATQMLGSLGFEVDYVEILNYDLTPFNHNDSNKNSVALIAATIHSIRLIDNILLGESTDSN